MDLVAGMVYFLISLALVLLTMLFGNRGNSSDSCCREEMEK